MNDAPVNAADDTATGRLSLRAALDEFRRRRTAVPVRLRGRQWKILDTGGPGPVLVMLPGTLGNADIFFRQIEALGQQLRIIALAYPLIADVERLADDIASLLDRLGIGRASVLGSSFGGFMAQVIAERHPRRLDTVFIGNSLNDVDLIRPGFPPAGQLVVMPPRALRAQIATQMAAWSTPEPIFAELRDLLLRELREQLPPRAPKLRLSAILLCKRPPVPALPDRQIVVIDCQDDPLIPPAVRDDVRNRYPAAAHHRLPSGGHFPYLTRSRRYNQILKKHLLSS